MDFPPGDHRICVDGKFFRLAGAKFHPKGVAYGPFAPGPEGAGFPAPERVEGDFRRICELGANLVRVYEPPPRWFLDLAARHGLHVFIDIPWNQQVCFLDSAALREQAREAVRKAVGSTLGHPAVFAYSVANEIPADVVRWSDATAVARFIDELIAEVKRLDPQALCTYSNFPSTEFLAPQALDFLCFNVYLHQRYAFRNYLARLQMLADGKPLLLGETGVDSLREGEPRKCELLRWQIAEAFQAGLAGVVVFGFTDDWWRAGRRVEDWQMGLTDEAREPKPSFFTVQEQFAAAPFFPLPRTPRVSVVVASYNGERTLRTCLDSLVKLQYTPYEVILVDDGSTDATARVAADYPSVRYIRHEQNLGLSAARNTGIAAAGGEIVAFTDSDCRADEAWLYYVVSDLLRGDFVAVGGPNLLPPDDSAVAAAVMASPGGPAHVMLTDRQAEHIPGCNMVFWKWALEEVGGFDPIFQRAGDDVDICWRVQQAGWKIGFSPAGFVWHYRRSAIRDYLRQQQGYGEAEGLLLRKHPEYFNALGGGAWRGRIYGSSSPGISVGGPIIYRGSFGSAGFQSIYASAPAMTLMFCTTLEYHALVSLPLWVLSALFPVLLPLAVTSLLISLGVCAVAGAQGSLPAGKRRWWSRPLVAWLFLLQPLVRGWARYRGRLTFRPGQSAPGHNLDTVALRESDKRLDQISYWSDRPVNRVDFLRSVVRRLDEERWPNKADIGWSDHDIELYDTRWARLQLTTVAEVYPNDARMIRCRLRGRWSMRATLAFWLLSAVLLLGIGMMFHRYPGVWAALVGPMAFAFYLRRQQRSLQSATLVLLDLVARECGLANVTTYRPPVIRSTHALPENLPAPVESRIDQPRVVGPTSG